jgi:hypothetical protein
VSEKTKDDITEMDIFLDASTLLPVALDFTLYLRAGAN